MHIFDRIFKARDKPKNMLPGSTYSFFFGSTTSGKTVNERTALQTTAVYACVRILSETIASMPLHTYRYTDRGKDKALDHPLYYLLHNEPNSEMTSFVFRETLMSHLLLWGNAYAQIIRDGRGQVLALCCMSLSMKHQKQSLETEAREAIKALALEDWEQERLQMIEHDMAKLEIKLSQTATNARPGRNMSDVYDDLSVRISYELEDLKREGSRLNAQLKEFKDLEETMNWFLDELNTIADFDPETQRIELRDDIFHRIVERGIVYNDGRIVYEFVFGIKRAAIGNDCKAYLIDAPQKRKQTRRKKSKQIDIHK